MYTICIETEDKRKILGRNRRTLKAAESYALDLRNQLNSLTVPAFGESLSLLRNADVVILDHFAKEVVRYSAPAEPQKANKHTFASYAHEVWHVGAAGPQVVKTFKVRKAFSVQAYGTFDAFAKKYDKRAKKVKDKTVAGYHWTLQSGDVLELH